MQSGPSPLTLYNQAMPELPEVETVRRGLAPHVTGATVVDAVLGDTRVFKVLPRVLAEELPGQRVLQVERRGKFLVLELEHHYLLFHLGMTGQLTVQAGRGSVPDRHTHLQIMLSSGIAVVFRDVRKFGRVFLLQRERSLLEAFFSPLGLEPFTSEYGLPAFLQRCRRRGLRVKSLLLDQRFVAGVGNIYADEALFEAGIHPERRVHRLTLKEKERLFRAIPLVLERGIESGGTSFRDFVQSDGSRGSNQQVLNVYGRGGKPCRRCGSPIERIVVSQRGTHFCPSCQRKGRPGLHQ
jgi:formamidopyrimidine-DNA glycosylase